MSDEDDLFAPRPAKAPDPLPPRRTRPVKMKPNPGHVPREAKGKRVVVELANGRVCGEEPVTAVTPPGWAADGTGNKPGCRWSLTGSPWDIAFYRVL